MRDWDGDGDLEGRIEGTQTLLRNDGSGVLTDVPGFWPPNPAPNTFYRTPDAGRIRRVLAAIHDPASIARVLGAMGLSPAGTPELAASRAPPGRDDGQAE